MRGIAAYEHGLAKFYHDSVREMRGVKVWGPDFSRRSRAPTVSITLDKASAAQAATALGERRHLRLGRRLLRRPRRASAGPERSRRRAANRRINVQLAG